MTGNSVLSLLGSTPRERLASAGWLVLMFGGLSLGLYAIDTYRPLHDLTLGTALGAYLPLLVAFFFLVRQKTFPDGTPVFVRVAARAGWAACACFGLTGVLLTANGVRTPQVERTVVCVARRMTRQPDPARRNYTLTVRAWPGADRTAEVQVPRSVFDAVQVGDSVVLAVGIGRFGIEWQRGASLPVGRL